MLRLDINLLFTVINLLILYVLMRKFLFGPVNAIIAKRQAEADEILLVAKEKETSAEELKKQYDDSLMQIKEEEKKVMEEAHKKAQDEHDRILKQAKEEAKEVLAEAKTQAELDKKRMLEASKDELADMILHAGEELYMTQIGEAVDDALYQQFLEKVGEEK